MRTRALTVMATRFEDHHLVEEVALKYGVKSRKIKEWGEEERVVPCWGLHPWFVHLVYDDVSGVEGNGEGEQEGRVLKEEEKIAHYASVLLPKKKVEEGAVNEEDREVFNRLPDPKPLSGFLSQLRGYLSKFPLALVGEIGLDRSFRIPYPWTEEELAGRKDVLTIGGREGRKLTPYRCNMEHQKAVFTAQLKLAGEMNRAVSVHGVQAHGVVFECLKNLWKGHEITRPSKRQQKKRKEEEKEKGSDAPSHEPVETNDKEQGNSDPKPYPPRICLHSFSGGPDVWKQYLNPSIPVRFFASFSTAINLGDIGEEEEEPESFAQVVREVPDGMVLVESDLHTAGEEMDKRMEDVVRRVCKVRGWEADEGRQRLGANWRVFAFGQESGETVI